MSGAPDPASDPLESWSRFRVDPATRDLLLSATEMDTESIYGKFMGRLVNYIQAMEHVLVLVVDDGVTEHSCIICNTPRLVPALRRGVLGGRQPPTEGVYLHAPDCIVLLAAQLLGRDETHRSK